MITFFRINAAYKFIFLFLLFLGLRIPVIINGLPLTIPELNWMLIGEKMSLGFSLYDEIWDDISPLSALIYWIIDRFFGKSHFTYQIIASILVFAQAILLNDIFRRRQVFIEITLLPAFLYIIITSCFIDFYTLSPALLANTFILLVLNYTLWHVNEKSRKNAVFEIGAYTGVATLFFLPSFFIIVVPLFSFMLLTGTKLKGYFLMLFSFLFTIGISFLTFYMSNDEYSFYQSYFESVVYVGKQLYLSPRGLLIIFTIPILITLWALATISGSRYTNYQNRCRRIMSFWLVASLLSVFLSTKISANNLSFSILAMTFFMSHMFLNLKRAWLRELLFLLLVLSVAFSGYATIYRFLPEAAYNTPVTSISIDQLVAKSHPQQEKLKGKKILVLGDNISYYRNSKLATPYLNWKLSQHHFSNMNQYNIMKEIYENFQQDLPDVIVDEKNYFEQILTPLPIIASQYQKQAGTNMYVRIKQGLSNKK